MSRDETRLPHPAEKAEHFSEKSGVEINTSKLKRGVTRRRALKVLAAGAAGAAALQSTGCIDESETAPNTGAFGETTGRKPVSYTHLTLPTKA